MWNLIWFDWFYIVLFKIPPKINKIFFWIMWHLTYATLPCQLLNSYFLVEMFFCKAYFLWQITGLLYRIPKNHAKFTKKNCKKNTKNLHHIHSIIQHCFLKFCVWFAILFGIFSRIKFNELNILSEILQNKAVQTDNCFGQKNNENVVLIYL